MQRKISTKQITLIGILCGVAYLVMLLKFVPPLNIPIFSATPFLTIDIKDVIIVMGAFMLNPLAGVIISIIVSLIEMVTVSSTAWIGFAMNVLSTCAFVLPASLIYRTKRTRTGALIGLIAGVIVMTASMMLWNYIVTPIYQNVPRSVVAGLLIPVFMPFNLIKGVLASALSFFLYKPLVRALRRANLLENKMIKE